MKKILVGATVLAAMIIAFRTVASMKHIENMLTDWHNTDFKNRININLGNKITD